MCLLLSFLLLLLLLLLLQPLWVYGLLNCRWVFSAGRFLQSAVASGTSNPQPGGPVVYNVPTLATRSPQRLKRRKRTPLAEGGNCREFCRKWRHTRHFWVLLHAANLRHETGGFTSPAKEGALRIFSPEKSDGFGRVWTRELGYQRPARLLLDHRSRYIIMPCNFNILYY